MQLEIRMPITKFTVGGEFPVAPGESLLDGTQFRLPPFACAAPSIVFGAEREMTAKSGS